MNEPNRPAGAPSSEWENPIESRGLSPGTVGARSGNASAEADQNNPIFKKALEILRQQQHGQQQPESTEQRQHATRPPAAEADSTPPVPSEGAETTVRGESSIVSEASPTPPKAHFAEPQIANEPIPARMFNEFVYCRRLFYYEFVEGVFVESADTLRGAAIHERVDSGSGALPAAKRKSEAGKQKKEESATPTTEPESKEPETPETIHSRSVQMGSERLGVVAKMDLVESKTKKEDLFTALEVCPVDYKAGAPKEGEEANELWDTDKMQLGLQALILRDNGYTCNEGI
ncbi:MAG: hypothetical protein HY735_26820, partial [Verrucomicrobia bacterium]|nr:hypothetical protein [Verrucomicrobiota bacterium]